MLPLRSPGKENGFRSNLRRPRVDAVREFPKGCGRGVRSVQPTECEEGDGDRNTLTLKNVRLLSHRVDVRGGCGKVGSYSKDAKGKRLAVPFSQDKEREKLRVADVVDKARIRVKNVLAAYEVALTEMRGHSDPKYAKLEGWKLYSEAATYIKNKWVNQDKRTGHIPGVEVGDKFRYRPELTNVGLHGHYQSGIDYMKDGDEIIATSVIESGRYANKGKSADELIYIGQGGNPEVTKGEVKHQKAEGGNLALMNSKAEENLVRVIRKYKVSRVEFGYVYDGLYTVDDYCQNIGRFGKLVYEFTLRRIPGQLNPHSRAV